MLSEDFGWHTNRRKKSRKYLPFNLDVWEKLNFFEAEMVNTGKRGKVIKRSHFMRDNKPLEL